MPSVIAKSDRREQRISDDPPVNGVRQRASLRFLLEMYHPWLLGLCGAAVGYRVGYLHVLSTSWSPVALDKVNTIMASFAGFLIAVIALMPGLEERSWMRRFRDLGYQKVIIGYFRSALYGTLINLGMTTATFFFSYGLRLHATFEGIYSLLWWGTLGFALAAIVRAMRLMMKLLLMK